MPDGREGVPLINVIINLVESNTKGWCKVVRDRIAVSRLGDAMRHLGNLGFPLQFPLIRLPCRITLHTNIQILQIIIIISNINNLGRLFFRSRISHTLWIRA